MTLPIARDLAAIGMRVNTVAPGLIDTPIYGQGEGSEAFKANLQKGVLFPQRLGFAGRAGVDGRRVRHQQLHERRDDPRRRRHPHAAEMMVGAHPDCAAGSLGGRAAGCARSLASCESQAEPQSPDCRALIGQPQAIRSCSRR